MRRAIGSPMSPGPERPALSCCSIPRFVIWPSPFSRVPGSGPRREAIKGPPRDDFVLGHAHSRLRRCDGSAREPVPGVTAVGPRARDGAEPGRRTRRHVALSCSRADISSTSSPMSTVRSPHHPVSIGLLLFDGTGPSIVMTFGVRLERFTVRAIERVPDATAARGIRSSRRGRDPCVSSRGAFSVYALTIFGEAEAGAVNAGQPRGDLAPARSRRGACRDSRSARCR